MSNDFLQKILFENIDLRAEFVSLEVSVGTALFKHQYGEPLQKLLAEALAISALLRALIKYEGKLTLQFRGSGAMTLLLAQCSERLSIRGLIKSDDEFLTEEEVRKACEQGTLAIMLEFANQPGKPYQGIVAWTGDSLRDAIEVYFENSEQLLTKIWLHYDSAKQSVRGCLLQATPSTLDSLGIKDYVLTQGHLDFFKVAKQIDAVWQQGITFNDGVDFIKHCELSESVRVMEKQAITFECTCSRARGEQAILMLGYEEASDEIANNKFIDVICEFCNQKYTFDAVDLALIFKKGSGESSGQSSYH